MNWEQIIAMNAPVITVVVDLFVWLRNDIKRLEDRFEGKLGSNIKRLEDRLERVEDRFERLEDKIDAGFLTVDDRLRQVEHEQARVAGLALTGKLPSGES